MAPFILIFPKSYSTKSRCCNLKLVFTLCISLIPAIADSISFRFSRFEPNSSILYQGDAINSLGAIELNKVNHLSRVGLVTYTDKVHLWDSSSGKVSDFTTHFSFIIDTLNQTLGHYGHGLTFFIAPIDFQIPPNSNGGFLGLLNTTTSSSSTNQIIFIEFDSFPNEEWDPPYEHVGINNNLITSANYSRWNASEHSGDVADVWVTYNAYTENLTVLWSYRNNERNYNGENSSLSLQIDLTQAIDEWVCIGFSAATGQYVERHNLLSWEFSSNLKVKVESIHFQLLIGVFSPYVVLVFGGIVVLFIVK